MSAQQKHSPRDLILRYFQEERDNKGNQRNSSSELYPPSVKKPKSSQLNRHVAFNKQRIYQESAQVKKDARKSRECLSSCLITRSPLDSRFKGGANNPAERSVERLPRTDSECQFKAPGIDFLTERDTNITSHEVKMRPSVTSIKNYSNKCDFFPKYVDKRPFKEQGTQTLYRESSAQTVAYLPEVMDKEMNEHLELFTLPSLLPGDKPPGLHEVEILERSRKRWNFKKAVKVNFLKQLHEARELTMKTKYKSILEAFEWESWIEREEYIQECQRMRLEIVIKMFDKREKEMHTASKTRMEMACERIEKSRQRGLHKNEIEYQRGKRRNDVQLAKTSRRWQKQSPMYALGSPCSEFYGPLIRHGVDPARRNFPGTNRKAFDIRMDDLEKRVNVNNLTCPFRKLKEWSKPKKYVQEYEQNFCSDKNLQKLYESLKGLRTQTAKEKAEPKCLRKRKKFASGHDKYDQQPVHIHFYQAAPRPVEQPEPTDIQKQAPHPPTRRPTTQAKYLEAQRRQEAFENLLNTHEGTHIGWVMQFLSEEMARLKEHRKLHFFTILAQKERWRREANEAGLRQKENEMRSLYEELFQKCTGAHNQVSKKYLNALLTTDMRHIAESEAAITVTGQARQIDSDIQRWLESFKLIQTPLTYAPLRLMLRDMVSPDMNAALDRHEKSLIVNYIVEDVIFGRVWEELEPIDIAGTLTSDFIDRLIDNDLYLFSTDSESETPQKTSCHEAEAIIRKLIRQAVPGQRWKDETERIVHENQNDLFDDVFAEIMNKIENPLPVLPSQLINLRRTISNRSIRMTDDIRGWEKIDYKAIREQPSQPDTELLRIQLLNLFKRMTEDKVTRELDTLDIYQGDDHLTEDRDVHIETQVFQHAVNKSEDNAWEPDAQKAAEVEAEVEVEEEAENEPEEEPESEEGIDMEFEDKLGAYYMSEADDEFENDNETDNSSDRIYSEELEEELSIPKEELTEPVGLTKGKKSQVKIITQEVVTEIIDQSPIQLLDPEEHEADLRAGGSVFKTSFNSTASHVASEYNLIQPIEHQTSDQILHEKPTTAKEVGKVVSRTGSQRSQRSQRK
ncbi:uncharacterized protein LOC117901463 isoform X4 [Drosophila subobscura]|uniref:uncharacterized protein LOC117901463 isoform X4 n=1 Tax=Drosophila subobscura TaxID=7241 RepID=UPI00155B24D2|nr:uncharacterized protein LOC117901463 isoform X4 [Drosophila subobscura]